MVAVIEVGGCGRGKCVLREVRDHDGLTMRRTRTHIRGIFLRAQASRARCDGREISRRTK